MKKAFKISCVSLIILSLVISIGVLLPLKTFKEKQGKIHNLLITNCNIVDVINGKIILNKQVFVQKGKIIAIETRIINVPKNTKKVDANYQYLMPSLWDMHVHTLSLSPQLHFPLLIANGVTGIRDMGDGDSWISDIDDNTTRDRIIWKKEVANNNLLMPKIFESTSYHIEELDGINKNNYKQIATEIISKLKFRGESFAKVQLENAKIPNYIFYELQKQAKKQKLPILGHLSPSLGIGQVLENEFKSIEHAWALIPHFVKNKKKQEKDIAQKKYDIQNQDSTLINKILANMATKGVYYVPTHITSNRKEYLAFEPTFSKNINNQYVENVQLALWNIFNWLHIKSYDKTEDLPILKAYYQQGLQTTNLAQKKGIKILAGTDALDRNVYYVISLHDELIEMVKAGLTNAEALKTATYNAVEYHKKTNDYGSIAVEKKADFILLNKNPLEKIENTKTINAVFYNNCWYYQNDLLEMKKFSKTQAKSFGISCKFIWNMIKQN